MNLSRFAIIQLTPYVTGDGCQPSRSGPELVQLFNNFGTRDIYDFQNGGLPDIGKKNGQKPSRKEYVVDRMIQLNNDKRIRELLVEVFDDIKDKSSHIDKLNQILNDEGYTVNLIEDKLTINGGYIDRTKSVVNEAHFKDIQSNILAELDKAEVSIRLVMAWFTNETLFNKLVEKYQSGIDVQIAIYDDAVNEKYGVNINSIPNIKIRRAQRGGTMHDKFCIIDNQTVISGSYNWTNNAEFKNDENITIEHDPTQATRYSVEYRRLTITK